MLVNDIEPITRVKTNVGTFKVEMLDPFSKQATLSLTCKYTLVVLE